MCYIKLFCVGSSQFNGGSQSKFLRLHSSLELAVDFGYDLVVHLSRGTKCALATKNWIKSIDHNLEYVQISVYISHGVLSCIYSCVDYEM